MSTNEPFRTDYEFLNGVDYIFVSLGRNLSGEECHELAEKYFETHKQMTLPGQVLFLDLRPLADVTAMTFRHHDARPQSRLFARCSPRLRRSPNSNRSG